MDPDILPNGTRFDFWDDRTEYRKVYHVAQRHPGASDDNDGSADAPLATISRAAELLAPGEKAIVHAGVYRECVRPVRGGDGPDRMIAYEAGAGEEVVVTGAEAWRPAARPSAGWRIPPLPGGRPAWMADLPAERFGPYNPFLARNVYEYITVYGQPGDAAWMRRAMRRRGMIFAAGAPLRQVHQARDLAEADGTFWVEEPGLRVHFRLPGDVDPADVEMEVTAREQVFAPREEGLGYVRVSGFRFERAADGFPVPQRAAVSTSRGHHWIIESNRVEWANAVGMDIGLQSWDAEPPGPVGHHVVRGNTIRHCGVCGLAGAFGVANCLIEGNLIEHVGWQDVERMWECAGIKFHFARSTLLRRNILRRLRHACGIWLDCGNANCRVTDNVLADIETVVAGVYSEMNFETNLIDRNVFWDIRRAEPRERPDEPAEQGGGVKADCNETLVVAHNFFGRVEGEAVHFTLNQANRALGGRTGLCRANAAWNNVFHRCPHRLRLGRREDNRSDGNLFDAADDACSFAITAPQPGCRQDLAGWRTYFGLDEHSAQGHVEAEFDVESLQLSWRVDGPAPQAQPVPLPAAGAHPAAPGPFQPEAWQQSLSGQWAAQVFPST